MNQTSTNIRLLTIFLLFFTSFLFLFNIGERDLWAPDEPRYAQVAKEMWDSGNFILPQLNGKPYPDKPPFLFWLINLFSIPFGKITPLSARLPSAFAGVGCCLAMFYFAKNTYQNTRIGLLTALILATSTKFLWMAHRIAFDIVLTLFVVLAILSFYKGYKVHRKKGWYYTLFYVFMALGVLTKGPVGFIMPFLVILTFLFLKRDIRVLKDTKPWLGGVLFASIVFSWVYMASIYGGKEYTQQILFSQNVGRLTDSFAHKEPFYYYFINFPVNFFPWMVFIPSIALYLFSSDGRKKVRNILLPVVWFAVIFVFFSIVSGKRDIYVLPLYPASALITAWFFNEFTEHFRSRQFKKIGYIPCYFLGGLSIFLSILLPILVYNISRQYLITTIPFIAILFLGGIAMLRFIKFGRILPFVFTIIFLIFTIFNISTLQAIPILNKYKSARELCNKANAVMKPEEPLAIYNFFRSPYLFYTNKNQIEVINNLKTLTKYLRRDERVFLFIKEKDFKKVLENIKEDILFVIGRDSVGHRDMVLVSNRDIS